MPATNPAFCLCQLSRSVLWSSFSASLWPVSTPSSVQLQFCHLPPEVDAPSSYSPEQFPSVYFSLLESVQVWGIFSSLDLWMGYDCQCDRVSFRSQGRKSDATTASAPLAALSDGLGFARLSNVQHQTGKPFILWPDSVVRCIVKLKVSWRWPHPLAHHGWSGNQAVWTQTPTSETPTIISLKCFFAFGGFPETLRSLCSAQLLLSRAVQLLSAPVQIILFIPKQCWIGTWQLNSVHIL